MKIAIYEPDPRVCGPSAWVGHMRTGFSRLGHEVHTVAATKSGRVHSHWGNVKPGGKWWSTTPDVVVRMDELHNEFDKYDLILLPEPKVPLADKDARKAREAGDENALPFYIQALSKTKTPFTTALHGNPYNDSNSPFAGEVLALPNFTGTIIGHTAPLRTVSDVIAQYPQVDIPLPYTTRVDVDAPFPVNRTVGITGRFMFNKGSHVLGLAGQYLPPDVTVEIWGSCSTGRGPSLTFNLYEVLKPLAGMNYKRYHNGKGQDHPKANEDGNIVQPFPFDVRPEGGALVRYLGNYTDAVATCGRFMVHTNLTADRYTSGMEFSTMEALDAGSLCITQDNVSSDPAYRTLVMHGWTGPAGSVKTAFEKKADETKQVAEKVMEVFDYFSVNPKVHEEVVRHNRQALRNTCAPELVASRVLNECI